MTAARWQFKSRKASMSNFIVVSASDFKSAPIFEKFGGRAFNPRMGIVPWAGTAEQLYQHLKGMNSQILLVSSLSADCLLLGM
jgi:hypothetical protein